MFQISLSQAWNTMQAASSRPEPWLYASLIQCLWDSGVASAQAQAARLFAQGCDSGAVLPCLHQTRDPDRTLQVNDRYGVVGCFQAQWQSCSVSQAGYQDSRPAGSTPPTCVGCSIWPTLTGQFGLSVDMMSRQRLHIQPAKWLYVTYSNLGKTPRALCLKHGSAAGAHKCSKYQHYTACPAKVAQGGQGQAVVSWKSLAGPNNPDLCR